MVPRSLVHLQSTESPHVSDFQKKKKKIEKKESQDVSKAGLELDIAVVYPAFNREMFEDRHSSLIKQRDHGCVHCERSAVPPSVLLSASPFEELTVRPATKKKPNTFNSLCVCESISVTAQRQSGPRHIRIVSG